MGLGVPNIVQIQPFQSGWLCESPSLTPLATLTTERRIGQIGEVHACCIPDLGGILLQRFLPTSGSGLRVFSVFKRELLISMSVQKLST